MSFTHRCIRDRLWAPALLALAAVSSASAQDAKSAEDTGNLDVTMRLLPEGATRPDAVIRVIELPEAVRARVAGARERDVPGRSTDVLEETRRAAAARAGVPGGSPGPVATSGSGAAIVGASEVLEPASAGRGVGDTPTMSSARDATDARLDRPDAASRELDRGAVDVGDARDDIGRGRPDGLDAERPDADRPDRDRATDSAGRGDRGVRPEPAGRPDRRDLPERDRRSERDDPSEDGGARDGARERPDRPDAEDRSDRGNTPEREGSAERGGAPPSAPERP